ncbi:lipid A biosynthesis acyltransferase [Sulfurovum lithotrophicum]|uniref:Lipid A biosynthesis acyltransferase n=1 Tax=Sulfurovum lithotrophicum TaxID=206403 RepID=A0A7U4M009_9BACT|nr:lipid A biosynthesis lauroyl acyltransferase [Sulfurovum lithotrophicum]AKF24344.1 lipid A biosynthesis acyltransferase [Sulfurovum lithotrophicum]
MKDLLYLGVFNLFKFFVWIIPDRLLVWLMRGFSYLVYIVDRKHRKIAKVNLDLAYGNTLTEAEKEHIVRECYFYLAMTLADFVKNQGISRERLLSKVTFKNSYILEDALKEGRKVILVTAHYSNWELVALSIAAKFGPLTGVGRKLDSPTMDEILNQNRQQFDIEMLDKKGAMKSMIQALKHNRMLGLLVDQNTSENEGVLIDFFGKPVRHTPSAAILSRRFDAVIIPVFITTEDHKHYELTFYDPIQTEKTEDKEGDILRSVQQQANITEEIIRKKPEEWFWLHQRWKNQFEKYYE